MAKTTTQLELEITGKIGDVQKDIDTVNRKLQGLEGSTKRVGGGFAQLAAKLGLATIALGAAKTAVDGFLAKTTAMADLSAITGFTGQKLEELGNVAREASDKFGTDFASTVESAKILLSKLGPEIANNAEAFRLMNDNVGTFAKASGLEANVSASVLADAMNAMGGATLNAAGKAELMTKLMDSLAAGSQAGAVEADQVSQALLKFGSSAVSAGLSISETVGAAETMGVIFANGAEAGTQLRNVLAKMSQGRFLPKEVQKEFQQLGIDVNFISDATVPFADRLNALKPILNDSALLTKFFGAESQVAGRQMLANIDLFTKLSEAADQSGVANKQAAINMATPAEKMNQMINKLKNVLTDMAGAAYDFLMWAKGVGEWLLKAEQAVKKFLYQVGELPRLLGDAVAGWLGFRGEVEKTNEELLKTSQAVFNNTEAVGTLTESQKKQLEQMGQLTKGLEKKNELTEDEKKRLAAAAEAARTAADAARKLQEAHARMALEIERNAKDRLESSISYLSDLWRNWKSFREEMLSGVEIEDVGLTEDQLKKTTPYQLREQFEKLTPVIDAARTAMGQVFQGVGAAITDGTDAIKQSLKGILGTILDFLEAEFVAAGAAVAIRALISGSMSLFWDTAGYLAAAAALETARGFINSYEVGAFNVPRNQLAMIHQGEMIVPKPMSESIRRGEAALTGGGGKGVVKQRDTMIGNITVSFRSLESGVRKSEFITRRRAL